MRARNSTWIAAIVAALMAASPAAAQAPATGQAAGVWRGFASKIEIGSEITVRLRNGQRFRATLVEAQEGALLVQPHTRVPVAVQPVPYAEILSLEQRREGGMSGGKAVAIGIASGAATFLGVLLILLATVD